MQKISILCLLILSLACFTQSQAVFSHVKNLLANIRNDIIREDNAATARCNAEIRWISAGINRSIAKLTRRTKEVNAVKARIVKLNGAISHTTAAIKQKKARIASNKALFKKFKKERCENNFFFVKELAHIQRGKKTLRQIHRFFVRGFRQLKNFGKRRALALVEKVSEFAHLFDEQHKLILAELTSNLKNLPNVGKLHGDVVRAGSTRGRSAQEIGSGHIDNNRGELKRLRTPAYVNVHAFTTELERKILKIIADLVQHLKNHKHKLIHAEIKASRDFAKFTNDIARENRHLARRIIHLRKRRVVLRTRLARAKVQLARRELLRKEASIQLVLRRAIKARIERYCRITHNRRVTELANIRDAEAVFLNVLNAISKRVNIRAHEVVDAEPSTSSGLSGRQRVREAVAL